MIKYPGSNCWPHDHQFCQKILDNANRKSTKIKRSNQKRSNLSIHHKNCVQKFGCILRWKLLDKIFASFFIPTKCTFQKTAKSSNVISSNETSQILVSREYQIFVTHNRNDSGDAERIFSAILIVVLLSVYRLPPYFSPQMEINIMKILK